MTSPRGGHILIWVRDAGLATRLGHAFARAGLATSWAAALHEAIAVLDRHFPLAMACTLEGQAPSLMDLETLVTYQSMGHRFISMEPTPAWALSARAQEHAREIERLRLPVHLVPAECGAGALVSEITAFMASRPGANDSASGEVLLVDPDDAQGECFMRYLQSRGVSACHAPGPAAAAEALARRRVRAIVTEVFEPNGGTVAFLNDLARRAPGLPVVILTAQREWLRRVSPVALPRTVACTLGKPVSGAALEVCLRRLLRIALPAPAASHAPGH